MPGYLLLTEGDRIQNKEIMRTKMVPASVIALQISAAGIRALLGLFHYSDVFKRDAPFVLYALKVGGR